jgi:predicted dehydrogenase
MEPVKVGVVGCGNISDIYFQAAKYFESIELVACADLEKARSQEKAKLYNLRALAPKQLLADKAIEIVVNLTVPAAHAEVSLAALKAGKHVYSEKPLALSREEGQEILALADKKGLLAGCAPDTFMGAALQTARKLIDDGWIGRPVSATAFMQCHGHESWHPHPEFYYKTGGGPMFDMGPYYLTALVSLLGPVRRVCGSAASGFSQRTITSEEKKGTVIDVEVPTHIAGVLDFENGVVASIVTSFDVWQASPPPLEIHGTNGSLSVPDPNGFGGPVSVYRPGSDGWKEVPHSHKYAENSRGLGVADMAYAIRSGRPFRANGEMAYHALDIMHAFHDASEKGRFVNMRSSCRRPAPIPMDLPEGALGE